MYAIVDIAGQQYKVEKDQKIFVHRLEGKEGSKIDFDKVLLIDNDGKISVGEPVVKNMVVTASIVSHLKGDKVKVFKKKRRKGYKVLNGHRQYMTELLIDGIGEGKAKVMAEPKKETATKPAPKKETKAKTDAAVEKKSTPSKSKAAPKAKAKAETKDTAKTKAAPKKAAAKPKPASKTEDKSAAKKTAAKKPATKAAPKAKKANDKDSDK